MNHLTYLSYFLFFLLGFITTLASVVLIEIAASFQVDTYVIGYILALTSLGSILSIPLSGRLIEQVSKKRLTFAALLVLSCGTVGLASSPSWPLFALANLLYGFGSGMILSIGNYIIVHLYEGQIRSTRLNILNFSYSAGAVSAPFLGGFLVQSQFPWQSVYFLALCLPTLACFLTRQAPFAILKKDAGAHDLSRQEKWNARVYLAGTALFFYVVSEPAFTNWAVVYFRQNTGLNLADASRLLGFFFACMAIGRFLSGLFVHRVRLDLFILSCAMLAVITFALLLNTVSYTLMLPLTSFMGLCYSGLYASILSYGTLQLQHPSAKVVTFFIVMTSLGGVTGQFFSGVLKQTQGVTACLLFSLIAMMMVFFLTLATRCRIFQRP